MKINITSNIDDIMAKYAPTRVERAITASTPEALNKSIIATRNVAIKQVASANNMKRSLVERQILRLDKRDMATRNRNHAKIFAVLSPIPITRMGIPRQTARGAKVAGRTYHDSFVAVTNSGHRGVFKRTRESRLPIVSVTQPLTANTKAIVTRALSTTGVKVFGDRVIRNIFKRIDERRGR